QMPNTRSGQNVDAASAKANTTELATGIGSDTKARTSGTATQTAAATRRAAIGDTRPRNPSTPLMPWATTPASAIDTPEDVDRKAANAPAVTSAVSSSPAVPPNSRLGSSRTTVSARPESTRSEA